MEQITLLRVLRGLCIGIFCLAIACQPQEPQWYTIEGPTMGSTYHVQYHGQSNYQGEVDKLLLEIDEALSTYNLTSVISQFNQTGELDIPLDKKGEPTNPLHGHFFANLEAVYDIFKLSNGYFDPTVGPIVEVWGFGKSGQQAEIPDSTTIDSLRALVGLQYISVNAKRDTIYVRSTVTGLRLDFNALAAGYAADKMVELLSAKGVVDCFVEVTGEVRATGKSPRGDEWVVGINIPEEGAGVRDIAAKIRIKDTAMATSGNYRNFYILDGKKVWHTINPKTGYPEENTLLSATIVHPRCMIADALATACMAVGVDQAIGLIRQVPGTEGYFIYRDVSGNITTFVSDNLSKDLLSE